MYATDNRKDTPLLQKYVLEFLLQYENMQEYSYMLIYTHI